MIVVESLNLTDPFPKRQEIRTALNECRIDRNANSHCDGDPNKQGANDAQLASLVESARKYLPVINDLKGAEAEEVYQNLERLEGCLYFRKTNELVEVVPFLIRLTRGLRNG